MSSEINNSSITINHLKKMNKDLRNQLRYKDIEIEDIQKQINDNFTMKLRKENQRDELTEFNVQNPYDKKQTKSKNARISMSPLEQNNSTYTQNTNLVYSEEQSAYSGVHNHVVNPLNAYLPLGKTHTNSQNAISLEGTFISRRENKMDQNGKNNDSINENYGEDNYNVENLIFNKNRGSQKAVNHNMTFGELNQQLAYKVSEKKVRELTNRKVVAQKVRIV
jgi:hypothetical protein